MLGFVNYADPNFQENNQPQGNSPEKGFKDFTNDSFELSSLLSENYHRKRRGSNIGGPGSPERIPPSEDEVTSSRRQMSSRTDGFRINGESTLHVGSAAHSANSRTAGSRIASGVGSRISGSRIVGSGGCSRIDLPVTMKHDDIHDDYLTHKVASQPSLKASVSSSKPSCIYIPESYRDPSCDIDEMMKDMMNLPVRFQPSDISTGFAPPREEDMTAVEDREQRVPEAEQEPEPEVSKKLGFFRILAAAIIGALGEEWRCGNARYFDSL